MDMAWISRVLYLYLSIYIYIYIYIHTYIYIYIHIYLYVITLLRKKDKEVCGRDIHINCLDPKFI